MKEPTSNKQADERAMTRWNQYYQRQWLEIAEAIYDGNLLTRAMNPHHRIYLCDQARHLMLPKDALLLFQPIDDNGDILKVKCLPWWPIVAKHLHWPEDRDRMTQEERDNYLARVTAACFIAAMEEIGYDKID